MMMWRGVGLVLAHCALLAASGPCDTTKCQQLERAYAALRNQSCAHVLAQAPALATSEADAFVSAYRSFDGNASSDEGPVLRAAERLLSEAAGFLSLPDSFELGGLDFHLARCAVLVQSTGLAAFAATAAAQESLVDKLLQDPILMRDMLVAGGASGGQFGQAMLILDRLLNGTTQDRRPTGSPWDDRAPESVLRRLALGIALEFATPVSYMNVDQQIDPIERYNHYSSAYRAGELDPAFQVLTGFECRHVVSSPALNQELAWMRDTLGHTRPDHIGGFGSSNSIWRYAMAARTDVQYGHSSWLGDPHNYSQIPAAGGECGPRAWFGRFARRAFGLPVWGVKQPGHACMATWSPEAGWATLLGADWSHSWWSENGESTQGGPDFVLDASCRENRSSFQQVLRGQWLALARGEPPVGRTWSPRTSQGYGQGGLWGALMLYKKKLVVSAQGSAPPSREVGPSLISTKVGAFVERWGQKCAKPNITISPDGTINIPAAAAQFTRNAAVMKSFDETAPPCAQQLCSSCMYAKPSSQQESAAAGFDFEYVVEVGSAGTASLSLQFSTWHVNQDLQLAISTQRRNRSGAMLEAEVPVHYTTGYWNWTEPIEVKLASGTNWLQFARRNSTRGIAIKELTLTPRHDQ